MSDSIRTYFGPDARRLAEAHAARIGGLAVLVIVNVWRVYP